MLTLTLLKIYGRIPSRKHTKFLEISKSFVKVIRRVSTARGENFLIPPIHLTNPLTLVSDLVLENSRNYYNLTKAL